MTFRYWYKNPGGQWTRLADAVPDDLPMHVEELFAHGYREVRLKLNDGSWRRWRRIGEA